MMSGQCWAAPKLTRVWEDSMAFSSLIHLHYRLQLVFNITRMQQCLLNV